MASEKPFKIEKILIVGGGNAAHAMAALFPHKGFACNMLVRARARSRHEPCRARAHALACDSRLRRAWRAPARAHASVQANFADEAERINAALAEQGHIAATFASHNNPAGLSARARTSTRGHSGASARAAAAASAVLTRWRFAAPDPSPARACSQGPPRQGVEGRG